jgi:hypothetical protein
MCPQPLYARVQTVKTFKELWKAVVVAFKQQLLFMPRP